VTAMPYEHAEQARTALRAIVAEHGPGVLSSPATLANLLSDLLPDAPRIARLLVAAAQDQIADELREHTSVGMDAKTASRLAASSFAGATMFAPEACAWVVDEFAVALGLASDPRRARGGAKAAETAPDAVLAVSLPAGQPAPAPASTQPASTEPASSRPPPRAAARQSAGLDGGAGSPRQEAPGPRSRQAAGTGGGRPAGRGPEWMAVVTADRAYFDDVVAGRDADSVPIEFPGEQPARTFRLSGTQMRIGRRSASRALVPEIDLSGPPADPGISHLHAVLIASQDGTWAVLDTGSSNGTQVNGRDNASGEPAPLRDGDSICLGAWTRLTIRSG